VNKQSVKEISKSNNVASVARHDALTRPHSSGPSGATLAASGVSAWYGCNKVLENVTLDMGPGGVSSLIGPSGCGKSTFLRILNRMHELTPGASLAGEVHLDGEDIYGRSLRPTKTRLQIGMVFQKPNPFPNMTVLDNVLAGLKLARIRSEDSEDLARDVLQRAGLWFEVRDRLHEPGGSLSGGQQQRLCIARALAVNPKVLLMDEPCSSLDPTSTRRIEETIGEIAAGVTVVIVTHNMAQALRVSDTCAFFLADEKQPGRIIEWGKTAQIFSEPTDPRTEDYIQGLFG